MRSRVARRIPAGLLVVLLLTGCSAKPRDLTLDELGALTGQASMGFMRKTYSGSIYNGNPELRVIEVDLWIAMQIGGKKVRRVYRANVDIGPLQTRDFVVTIVEADAEGDHSWTIIGAKGIREK